MRDLGMDILLQAAGLVLYTVTAAIFAGAGLLIEYHSFLYFMAGDHQLAVWIGAIGIIAFVAASLIVRDKIVRSVGELRSGSI